ncbi:MAG: hypothetical protein PHX43_00550 [Alphaproteobacteria bacterium]|nr:hypothetical protein [Alphaproteobacteria bacterium]
MQQKFDSDTERQMAVLLEDEKDVLKWFKPLRNDVKIYTNENNGYEPDFVVKTVKEKILVETKRADEVDADAVQQKARAAVKWCEAATKHEMENGGKAWCYLIVPHDAVKPNATPSGLLSQYRQA